MEFGAYTRPREDHTFMPTLTGRCLRCQRDEEVHVRELAETSELEPCKTDHSSLVALLVWTEKGASRTICGACNVQLEPKMATGLGPAGRKWERGRGELTFRQKERLNGWAGWWAFNGGDE